MRVDCLEQVSLDLSIFNSLFTFQYEIKLARKSALNDASITENLWMEEIKLSNMAQEKHDRPQAYKGL